MSFSFTDEHVEFRSVLRRFLTEKSPTAEVRRLMETDDGYDPEVWRALSQELGLTALHIPEDYGGQGFGAVELAIALEEMGRALLCAPYFSSIVLAATAIIYGANEDQKRALLPPIAAGEIRAALAFTEENGRWEPGAMETEATAVGDTFELNGVKSFVLDGHTAQQILVMARDPGTSGNDGLSLFLTSSDTAGLQRRLLKSMDGTRKLARLEFKGVKATLLGEQGAAATTFAKTLNLAVACLANEMVGGAEALREQALDYAQMRMQFGRAISSFQTMKHKQADMLIDVELAKSAAYYAAAAADEEPDELPAVASLAKAGASEAYLQTAIHTIQIHGGIGFTWDNDTHLWFKRAKSSQVFLGDANFHRERMLQCWQG